MIGIINAGEYGRAIHDAWLRRELIEAGFEHPAAPIYYVLFRFSMAIGLPLLFLVTALVVSLRYFGEDASYGPNQLALMVAGYGTKLGLPQIMRDDGEMARMDDLEPFARRHELRACTSGLGQEAALDEGVHGTRHVLPAKGTRVTNGQHVRVVVHAPSDPMASKTSRR